MSIPSVRSFRVAVAAVTLALAGSAAAQFLPSFSPPDRECVRECLHLRRDCGRACNASFQECMLPARIEMRTCSAGCAEEHGEDTPEFETCVATCRDEILVPALEQCRPLRRECTSECSPGACRLLCRNGEIGEDDECKGACAGVLRECAKQGKAALWECLAPCREVADETEREACATACLDEARASAATCVEDFGTCTSACEEPATTTTLPLP